MAKTNKKPVVLFLAGKLKWPCDAEAFEPDDLVGRMQVLKAKDGTALAYPDDGRELKDVPGRERRLLCAKAAEQWLHKTKPAALKAAVAQARAFLQAKREHIDALLQKLGAAHE